MGGVNRRRCLLAGLTWLTGLSATQAADPLIGRPAPERQLAHWRNSGPLSLKQLRGQAVLVRWWTAPNCELCRTTAPALNEFHTEFAARGLRVIGVYHHKVRPPLDPARVAAHAAELGFKFPVAIDPDWQTLRRWWLDGHDRAFTSVTFLLDRRGVIRHIHPGGQFVKGDADYAALRAKVTEVLAEP
jgi:peroxiredoxin